jgi:hypothetical protein
MCAVLCCGRLAPQAQDGFRKDRSRTCVVLHDNRAKKVRQSGEKVLPAPRDPCTRDASTGKPKNQQREAKKQAPGSPKMRTAGKGVGSPRRLATVRRQSDVTRNELCSTRDYIMHCAPQMIISRHSKREKIGEIFLFRNTKNCHSPDSKLP